MPGRAVSVRFVFVSRVAREPKHGVAPHAKKSQGVANVPASVSSNGSSALRARAVAAGAAVARMAGKGGMQ